MKIKNIFNLLMISVVALMAFSCTEKAPKYEPGTPDEKVCYDVYFPEQQTDFVFSKSSPKEIVITIARKVTSGAITVPCTLFEETNTVTASEIKFADGQSETTCKLSFEKAEIDKPYKGTITITDPQYASKYNANMAMNFTFIIENYNLIGTVQFFDQLAYMSDATTEGLGIQEVEFYQKEGVNFFRIVDPFANRARIEEPDVWGPGSTLPNYSKKWEFYLKKDGAHIAYDEIIYPGIFHSGKGEQIIYELPSNMGDNYANLDDNVIYYDEPGIFMLNPAAEIENTTSWFGQILVWVGMPDVDLASYLL